jgi:hypothetical protein
MARIGKYDYLDRLRVDDDLGRLSICDGLRRRGIIWGSYRRFLFHFRIGRRIRGDGSVLETGVCVRLRSDLLHVLL